MFESVVPGYVIKQAEEEEEEPDSLMLQPKSAAAKSAGKQQPLFQVDVSFQAPNSIEFSPSGHEFAQRIDATISDFVNMLKTVRRRRRRRHAQLQPATRECSQPRGALLWPAACWVSARVCICRWCGQVGTLISSEAFKRYTQPVINGRQDTVEINEGFDIVGLIEDNEARRPPDERARRGVCDTCRRAAAATHNAPSAHRACVARGGAAGLQQRGGSDQDVLRRSL
jgi:hypothetical protein